MQSIFSFLKVNDAYSKRTIDILRLIRAENVGPKTFFSLMQFFGNNIQKAIDSVGEFSKNGGRSKPIKVPSVSDVSHEIEKINRYGAKILSYEDVEYSSLLRHIHDFPPLLTYIGDLSLLSKPNISIVGARNASLNGRQFATKISKELSNKGFVITSGMAVGIDTAAHNASLAGGTIAVLAGGIDNIYPAENAVLYKAISESGLILSEVPFGTHPSSHHFPQRNRIIAGLSEGIVVIEAGLKSGSLITARYALQNNRDIFAVPGFPLDPRCQGSNKLIKEGAYLIESIDDIVDNLSVRSFDSLNKVDKSVVVNKSHLNDNSNESAMKNSPCNQINFDLINNSIRKEFLQLLSTYPIELDLLAEQLGVPLPVVYCISLELELAGKIVRHSANKVALSFASLDL